MLHLGQNAHAIREAARRPPDAGVFTLDAFTDMIFLCLGDLDIPDCVPARFRTL